MNLYVFVNNNPVDFIDLLGLIPPGWYEKNGPFHKEVVPGITIRRLVGAGGHQWITFSRPDPRPGPYKPIQKHVGVNKGKNGGIWVDETRNRPKKFLENTDNYYEWLVDKIDWGEDKDGNSCKCLSVVDAKKCIARNIVREAKSGTPDNFNILTNNCRDNSERILKDCCVSKGKMINNPNNSSALGRLTKDVFVAQFIYSYQTY